MQRIPEDGLHWKNQVIIACTITVAVEMLMISMMVMCWRQIRWTLLKLTCSCVRLSSGVVGTVRPRCSVNCF